MLYFPTSSFEPFNAKLSNFDCSDSLLSAKMDCYSFKRNKKDRKLVTAVDKRVQSTVGDSDSLYTITPLGNMKIHENRQKLANLILLLNLAFPDFSFDDLTPQHFQRHTSPVQVLKAIANQIIEYIPNFNHQKLLYEPLKNVVNLSQCEIFSFLPEEEDNIFEGSIWCINYVFYARKQKRLVFIRCQLDPKPTETTFSDFDTEPIESFKGSLTESKLTLITPINSDSDDDGAFSFSQSNQVSDDEDDTITSSTFEPLPFV